MKQNGISLNTLHRNGKGSDQNVTEANGVDLELIEQIGDEHVGSSYDTHIRQQAFEMNDSDKEKTIEYHFRQIMETMG